MKSISTLIALVLLSLSQNLYARTLEMNVDGLVCAFCAQGIEKKLMKQAATAEVYVSLEHHLVAVALKDGQDIADEQLRELLRDAGYSLREIKRSDEPLDALRQRTAQP